MAQHNSKLMVLINPTDSSDIKNKIIPDKINDRDKKDHDGYVEEASIPTHPPSPEIMSPPSFCTMSNFQSAIVYLSQELQNLGFRYKLIEANGEKLNLIALVNACWNVIQLYHNAIKDGNILHDSRRRDVADLTHLQGSVRELKSQIEEKDKQLQESQEKERQSNSMNKALAAKLKLEKDEVRRMNSILQQRDAQHQHENRKKELEINKLQDRLHRLVSGGEKGVDSRAMPSMTLAGGSLSRSDRARGRWRTEDATSKHEEELYQRVLGQYESWVGQVTAEADMLKEFLASVTSKISRIALKCAHSQLDFMDEEKDFLDDSVACSVLSSGGIEDDPLFSLNFVSVKDRLQKIIEDHLQIIGQVIERKDQSGVKEQRQDERPISKESNGDEGAGETEVASAGRLEADVADQVHQLSLGACVEKEATLEDELRRLTKERRQLQREKDTFAAAAVRLNRERAAFEAEKVELLRRQFLEEFPSFSVNSSKEPFTPNTSFENSLSQSLSDLYGDSPRSAHALPAFVCPGGPVTRTTRPLTLGPNRIPRTPRDSSYGTQKSAGGRSEPATRQSSLNRRGSAEMRHLPDPPRAKTLERPKRRRSGSREGGGLASPLLCSLTRPAGCAPHPLSLFPSLSQSVHCPLLGSPDNRGSRLDGRSAEFTHTGSSTPSSEPPGLASLGADSNASSRPGLEEELPSRDSGFSCDGVSSSTWGLPFLRANTRLHTLENSLTTLLRHIDGGQGSPILLGSDEKRVTPNKGGGGVMLTPSHGDPTPQGRVATHLFRPRRQCSTTPAEPLRATSITPQADKTPQSQLLVVPPSSCPVDPARRHSRLKSAPASASSSRGSSRDRPSPEDYFKRIQSNVAKWYWK